MKKLIIALVLFLFSLTSNITFAAYDTTNLEGSVFETPFIQFIYATKTKDRVSNLGQLMSMKTFKDWDKLVKPELTKYLQYLLETNASPLVVSKITRMYINHQILSPKLKIEVITFTQRINLSTLDEENQKATLDLFVFLTERIRWNNERHMWVKVGFVKDAKEIAIKLKDSFVKFITVIQAYIQTIRENREMPGLDNTDTPVIDDNPLPTDDDEGNNNNDNDNFPTDGDPSNPDNAFNT